MRACLLAAALGAWLSWGCTADDPETRKLDTWVTADTTLPDAPQGCPAPASLTVALDSYPDPTCYLLQPFRGTAAGAHRVVAQGGAGAAAPATVGSDGRFCIEVLLSADSLNNVTFSAVDANGCPGQALNRTIEHETCAQPDAGAALVNVAKGATVTSESTPSQGQHGDMVDGNDQSVVAYTGGWGWTDANIWVGIALGQPVELQEIVVRWRDQKGSGCDYGASYKIALSAYSDPGKMDLNSGMWTLLQDISGGDGGDDSFDLSSTKPLAQHVALLLNGNGCTGWSETFAIAEVEVWAKNPTTPQPQDRCGN